MCEDIAGMGSNRPGAFAELPAELPPVPTVLPVEPPPAVEPPMPRVELEPLPLPPDANHTMFLGTVALARREGLTVRQLLRALGGGVGHRIVCGTPEAIADDIEAWFRAGAADGFNLMPDVLPDGLETFVDAVLPILRRRGLFRTDYRGTTLRDHLGLSRPPSRFAA